MNARAARRWPLWLGATITVVALMLSTSSFLRRAHHEADPVVVVEEKRIAASPAPSASPLAQLAPPAAAAPRFDADEVERLIAAGATARARELIETAEKDATTRALAYTLHARLDIQRGALLDAEKHASRAIAIKPSVDALLARGDARLRAKDFKGAEADFRAVLDRAPGNAEALDGLELIERAQ